MAILNRLIEQISEYFDLKKERLFSDPSSAFIAITKADEDLAQNVKTLYIGGSGDVVVRGIDQDEDIDFKNVPAGTVLPLAVKRVAAATTATDIVGLL